MGRKIKCPKCGERFKIARVDRQKVVARIHEANSLAEVAEEFNVSRERISQIAREAGLKLTRTTRVKDA